MKPHTWVGLYLVSLIILAVTAAQITTPGYMDADYYFSAGKVLASGGGLAEPFIWNYLSSPLTLPVPAFTYWMPLPSLLAASGMLLAKSASFLAARLPTILIAALAAPLAGWLAYSYSRKPWHAWTAGLLAAFPGYYLPYLTTTSTFAPTMILGTIFVILFRNMILSPGQRLNLVVPGLGGIVSGLLHITRADGLIWLAAATVILVSLACRRAKPIKLFLIIASLAAGYLLVTGWWYIRNMLVFGTLFSPGSSRLLWLKAYDDLFTIHPEQINIRSWLASGIPAIFNARLDALGQNLLRSLAVQGELLLAPFIVVGAWLLRKQAAVKLAGLLWIATLVVMTVVFPFAGMRGGFFHSGAAVQLIFWSLVPVGTDAVLDWVGNRLSWKKTAQAKMVVYVISIGFSLIVTAGLLAGRITGDNPWNESAQDYSNTGQMLNDLGIPRDAVLMVNNPPGVYAQTGRPAVVIPAGGIDDVLEAANRYDAEYLLLDSNNQAYLGNLYDSSNGLAGFTPIGQAGELRIFRMAVSQ